VEAIRELGRKVEVDCLVDSDAEFLQEKVEELVLDIKGEEKVVSAEGLFFAIGHTPATKWLSDSGVRLNDKSYILTGLTGLMDESGIKNQELWVKQYPTMTNIPGVFAAGDCVDFRYRQAATASGMGVMAALDIEKWLENK